jgi:hypothetical protein
MKVLTKVLVLGGITAAASAATVAIRRKLRAGAHEASAGPSAGSMFVGAVDEVELSGPFDATKNPDGFDPEEVPSEHSEINELRNKMPFG